MEVLNHLDFAGMVELTPPNNPTLIKAEIKIVYLNGSLCGSCGVYTTSIAMVRTSTKVEVTIDHLPESGHSYFERLGEFYVGVARIF